MNRREFVSRGLSVPLAVGLEPLAEASVKPRNLKRPNVLFVFSDEHRACSLPGGPYNDALAPNIAKFARESLSFRNCISNYPVCSPYRGILMTGLWPYQSGIIDNAIQLRDDSGSIGKTFKDNGYYTSYIGKWHLSSNDNVFIPKGDGRQGFEDWHVWANTNAHFDKSFTFNPATGDKIRPRGYNCTLMTDEVVKFLQEQKATPKEKPWMMIVSWNPPHPQYDDAPSGEMEMYDPVKLRLRPNVNLKDSSPSRYLASEVALRETQRGYYAHITAVDKEFGRILSALEESGEADNTIIVYTSDHGDMMGSHGYIGKRLPHEESCNVPFFIRYPSITPAGRESSILFSAVDIYPSLCRLAGVPVPGHCVGRDLSAAMRGRKIASQESVFLMHIQKDRSSGGKNNPAPIFRGVRTDQYTYAVADDGRWCLFDNHEDPYQMHNLIADSSRNSLMHNLDGLVLDWMKKASDPYPYVALLGKRSSYRA